MLFVHSVHIWPILVSKLISGGLLHWTVPALEYWRGNGIMQLSPWVIKNKFTKFKVLLNGEGNGPWINNSAKINSMIKYLHFVYTFKYGKTSPNMYYIW